jgi:hypothetical protein
VDRHWHANALPLSPMQLGGDRPPDAAAGGRTARATDRGGQEARGLTSATGRPDDWPNDSHPVPRRVVRNLAGQAAIRRAACADVIVLLQLLRRFLPSGIRLHDSRGRQRCETVTAAPLIQDGPRASGDLQAFGVSLRRAPPLAQAGGGAVRRSHQARRPDVRTEARNPAVVVTQPSCPVCGQREGGEP